jgi:hypothetical protein
MAGQLATDGGSATALPASAYRATRYADWQPAALAYLPAALPAYTQAASLPQSERMLTIGRASTRVPAERHYRVVDTGSVGAAYYAPQRPAAQPLYAPWQAAVLDAVRMLRRWQYRSDATLPAPAANLPLDGCHCHTCVLRE